jgi:hypothetical protein
MFKNLQHNVVAVDPVGLPFGGLAMAGVFLLIAVMGAAASALARGQTRQQAILERAAELEGQRR